MNFPGGLLCIFLTAVSFFSFAQTGTIRGFLYSKETGEPVLFTTVYLEGTGFGSTTDHNGFFSIAKVPVGDYTLAVRSIEYDSVKVQVSVKENQIVTKSLYLEKRTVKIREVDVSARREEAKSNPQVSTVKVTPKDIELIPSVGGEPDIAQFLQIIPGVIFTGDQGGQLYVRGGAPVQTKVLLDGVTVYNPFHSIGLYSVFETDIIKSVDVYTGGFNAEYGDRLSAVIDIKTRDGNKNRLAGKVSANPFLAKGILEGPLMKLKETGSSISFLLNTKISYLDKTSPKLYSYVDEDGIPFSFRDYYGKISFNTGSGSKLNLFGFRFNDKAMLNNVSDFEWKSLGIGSNFVIVPGQSKVIISGDFAYSSYDIELQEDDGKPRTSSVGGFTLDMAFNYFIKNGEFKYGFDVNGFKTVFEFYNPLGLQVDQNQNTTELGAFFRYKKLIGKLVIEPSLRVQYYGSLSKISLEPRVGAKFNVTDNIRLKLAGGRYSQNLISGKPDKDVVNLFTSFLSGPEETLYDASGQEAKNNLQIAYHAIGGVEYNLTKTLELNIEPYYKYFYRLIDINRNKLYPQDPDFMTENGDAYGLDVLLKYDFKKFYIWAAYSLGYVRHTDGAQTYYPHYDRRHNVNLVTSCRFGRKPLWEASARWNFGSGFPFTRTQAFYPDFGTIFYQQGINTDYITANTPNPNDIGIVYEDDLNAGRLPAYHRLDFSLKSSFVFSERISLDIIASVTNVYNRNNIFYFDRIRYERVDQFPVLPSFGAALSF
ncbi:MAG TPA: carboxypeptidase-like regulatory domain-containing protein [Chitinophagales bacterium]|nr:carboxypeptidase-like regulatory domain-containing protein [Chitinophagales bacterium]